MRFLMIPLAGLALSACVSGQVPDSGAGVGFGDYDAYQAQQADPGAPPPTTVLPPEGGAPAPTGITLDNPEISSEQDFDSVAAERDIAADAERLAAARQQYQLVTPTELQRPDDTGPNIINYALASSNPVGNKLYRRNPFAARRAEEKCAGYRTADVAQEEFLSAGGPERDRLGLDPDGDGYACGWNPATFRNLVGN